MFALESRRFSLAALAISASLALAGCSGLPGAPGTEASVPAITGKPTSYASIEELRDAYVAAGGECNEWEPLDAGKTDGQGGYCNSKTTLAVFGNPDDLAATVKNTIDLAGTVHLLVGENWVVNTPNPQDFVETLGGTITSG